MKICLIALLILFIFKVELLFSAELSPEVIAQMSSGDPELRSDACLAQDSPEAIPLLLAKLEDQSLLVRHCAAYALARLGGESVNLAFRQGLCAANYDKRRICALGLGMMGERDALKSIRPLLSDDSWEVRWSAVYALGRSGDRQALKDLNLVAKTDAYKDRAGKYPVRQAARRAVNRLEKAIGWRKEISELTMLSNQAAGPIILYFRQSGDLCRNYEQEVFTDERVVDCLQQINSFWFDYANSPQLFNKHRIKQVPSFVFLDRQGKTIAREPGALEPSRIQGLILSSLGEETRLAQLRLLLAADPGNLELKWRLTQAYLEEGSLEQAWRLSTDIISRDPDNISSLTDNAAFVRAYILGKTGRFEESVREFRSFLTCFSFSGVRARALYCLGLAEIKAGRRTAGYQVLNQLIHEYPGWRLTDAAEKILSGKSLAN